MHDAVHKRLSALLDQYHALGIADQVDYSKFYLYSIITHSTALEGSTVTELENRLLFDEGIGAQKPVVEQMMNLDLKAAYEQGLLHAREHTDYSVELLCALSALAMKNTGSLYSAMAGNFSSAKGELRLLNVSAGVGGRSYPSYQKVPDRTEAFCQWLNTERKHIDAADIVSVYTLSFEAHYRLVSIHPWVDGNGRMSRLVMNMIQSEYGVVPSVVRKQHRQQYILSLQQSQEQESSAQFLTFMFNNHCDNLQQQIDEYTTSTGEALLSANEDPWGGTMGGTMALRIMEALAAEPAITMDRLSATLGIARRTLVRNMNKLQQEKRIQRVGGRRYGHWEVIR